MCSLLYRFLTFLFLHSYIHFFFSLTLTSPHVFGFHNLSAIKSFCSQQAFSLRNFHVLVHAFHSTLATHRWDYTASGSSLINPELIESFRVLSWLADLHYANTRHDSTRRLPWSCPPFLLQRGLNNGEISTFSPPFPPSPQQRATDHFFGCFHLLCSL